MQQRLEAAYRAAESRIGQLSRAGQQTDALRRRKALNHHLGELRALKILPTDRRLGRAAEILAMMEGLGSMEQESIGESAPVEIRWIPQRDCAAELGIDIGEIYKLVGMGKVETRKPEGKKIGAHVNPDQVRAAYAAKMARQHHTARQLDALDRGASGEATAARRAATPAAPIAAPSLAHAIYISGRMKSGAKLVREESGEYFLFFYLTHDSAGQARIDIACKMAGNPEALFAHLRAIQPDAPYLIGGDLLESRPHDMRIQAREIIQRGAAPVAAA